MEQTPIQMSIFSLHADLLAYRVSFDHMLQRKAGQWSTQQKSLLIDSILKGYQINPITMIVGENGVRYVIDGIQRLSTINAFITNGFRLSRTLKPIIIVRYGQKGKAERVEFEIAGKRFDKLDDEVKRLIQNYQITLSLITNYTDDEVREMFLRLNNGTAMNKVQKSKVLYSQKLYDNSITALESPVWEKLGITPTDIKKDFDLQILNQTLYALYADEVMGFKQPNIDAWIKEIQTDDERTSEQKQIDLFNKLYDVINVLDTAWTEPINGNKISIAPIIVGGSLFNGDEAGLTKYAEWIKNFFANQYKGSIYEYYCQIAGTASHEAVMTRINYFKSVAQSIIDGKDFVVEKAPVVE